MTTDRISRFRAVQADLQARRDRDRDRVPFTGVQVEALAEQIADVLYDRLAYVGECWIGLPPHSESDRPEPTARLDWRTEVRCTAATSSRSWRRCSPPISKANAANSWPA
jgi:hypothetical protein